MYTIQVERYADAKALIAIAALLQEKESRDSLWGEFFGCDVGHSIVSVIEQFVDLIGVDAGDEYLIKECIRGGEILIEAARHAEQLRREFWGDVPSSDNDLLSPDQEGA